MNLKRAAQRKLKKSGGFTLVEMLIVVAIIAILVVVSIPMVSGSLDKARESTDAANERAAKAAAMITYMTSNNTGTTTYYYDATSGMALTGKPTSGYNQAKANGVDNKANSKIIQVVVSDDGTVANDAVTWIEPGP